MDLHEKAEAILSIIPNADFKIINGTEFIWNDERPIPNEKQLATAVFKRKIAEDLEVRGQECMAFIHSFYPPWKQASDVADESFYLTMNEVQGVTNSRVLVYQMILDFLAGVDLKECIDNQVDENDVTRYSFEQLFKVGVRIMWVQNCKKEFYKAISEKRNPVYPKFPL